MDMSAPTSPMDMPMPSSTSSSMDMAMSMPMSMADMSMTFFYSHTTPLFSNQWTPTSIGQYAGTCIFLMFLSFTLRLFYVLKCSMEARWHARDRKRRYIVTQGSQSRRDDGESEDEDVEIVAPGMKGGDAVLTVNGVTERVRVVQMAHGKTTQPFRLSVDLVRALFVTLMATVGYLLMLAVMTMNVGYFLSVLAGAFVGELCFGRWGTQHVEDHH